MDWTSWGPPLLASGIGLASGLALVFRARGGDDKAEQAHALRAHKAALMERLRELDIERPKLTPASWEAEKRALVRQAAETLRELEAIEGCTERPSGGLGLPVGAVGAITLASILVLAWPEAESVPATQLDAPPTGGTSPHAMAEVAARGSALPDDLDALNDLAYDAILGGDLPTAMGAVEKARRLAPDDPLVRTHLDIMRMNVGMVARAADDLTLIIEQHPTQVRAILWLAYATSQQGDEDAARALLERVLELAPGSDDATMARSWMMEMDRAAGEAPTP